MRRFLILSLAMLSCTLFASLSASFSASAISDYDDAIHLTDEIVLVRNSHTLNVTTTFMNYIAEPSQYCTQSQIDKIQTMLNNPNSNWFISVTTLAADFTQMHFVISTDLDAETEFIDYGSEIHTAIDGLTSENTRSFSLILETNGNVTADCAMYYATNTLSISTGNPQLFLSTFPVEYPEGYEGVTIPHSYAPVEKNKLKPEYQYSLNKTGLFKLEYLENISPFLTGISYVVIEKMTENWEALDENITTITVNPAGWLKEEYQLPELGYYMIRIDHSQQLDSPPWNADVANNTLIEQVWIQLHYDGKNEISATTVNCTGSICNEMLENEPLANRLLSQIGVPIYGLQEIVLAPVNYLSELSDTQNNCTPLTLPLGFISNNIQLPCMTPIYQTHFSNIFIIYQTILVGLSAYYIGLRSFNSIKEISDPRNDQIETAKL